MLLQGYCFRGVCKRFPIVLGEFGSRLSDCRNRCTAAGCMDMELKVHAAATAASHCASSS